MLAPMSINSRMKSKIGISLKNREILRAPCKRELRMGIQSFLKTQFRLIKLNQMKERETFEFLKIFNFEKQYCEVHSVNI